MRRLTALVASAVLLGGVIVASPAAWANGLDDFELTGEFTDFEADDNGRDGPSKGDTFDFQMDLFDEDGDEAGDGDGTCELTEVNRKDREFTADCEAVFNLDDGDLEMSGEVTDEDFRDRKIVLDIDKDASTDDYEGAEGTVTFRPAHDGHGKGGHHHAQSADGRHGGGHGGHGGHKDGNHKVDIDVDFD